MTLLQRPEAVLFDLDGTLIDSAPDLAAAVNKLRTDRGLSPTPYEQLRPVASAGARGLIGAAFNIHPDDDEYESLRQEFLANYRSAIAVNTYRFDDISALLTSLEELGIIWGIVTNKATNLTQAIIPHVGLDHAACIICGDTTPFSKPHPEPLLEAARRINLAPTTCWYVGDDLRDITAGKAAGMATFAAGWGYCGDTEPVHWQADKILSSPLEITALIKQL